MKKFIMAIIALFVLFCATGCSDNTYSECASTETEVKQTFKDRFLIIIVEEDTTTIYVDKETRVMYLQIGKRYKFKSYSITMTILLDENGKPLLYEGELD